MAETPVNLTELKREISATLAEYDHALRGAFPVGLTGGPQHYRVEAGEVVIEIDLATGPERRIALLALPTLYVCIRFLSGDQAARERVLRRMDLAMQRGGG